jgi:hypothetical protein
MLDPAVIVTLGAGELKCEVGVTMKLSSDLNPVSMVPPESVERALVNVPTDARPPPSE